MLKMTGLPDEPAPSRKNGSKSASSRSNNSRQASERNDNDGKVNRFGGNSVEYATKLEKSKKLSKSQKLAKSGKKLLKSGNLLDFNAKNNGPSFLTPEARAAFNCF